MDPKPAVVNGEGGQKEDASNQSVDSKDDKKVDESKETTEIKANLASESKDKEQGKPKDTQLETLQKMARDRDFLGFTPLLRACQVYNTLKVNMKII